MSSTQAFVSDTNNYSIQSKWSTASKGYVEDAYISHFTNNNKSTRSPIINHGYWVRAEAIREAFQSVCGHTNVIISLGCGFDTSAFRYSQSFFIEFDYANVCQRKAEIIVQNNLLPGDLKWNKESHSRLVLASSRYLLFAVDLTQPSSAVDILRQHRNMIVQAVESFLKLNSFQDLNVVLFNECSLCYIAKDQSDALIAGLVKTLRQDVFHGLHSIVYLGYEMLRSQFCRNDFADFMLNHFKSLNAPILTFLDENQIYKRFTNELGFTDVKVINMKHSLRNAHSKLKQKRSKIVEIEPFDEIEELDSVCSVYALTIAHTKGPGSEVLEHHDDPTVNPIELSPNELNVSLYGHCSLVDSVAKCFYILGGFGINPAVGSQHQRSSSILKLSVDDESGRIMKMDTIKCQGKVADYQRIHARVVQLEANTFLLSGGRTSPSRVMDNVVVSIVDENHFELEASDDLNRSINAFRHVLTKFGSEQSTVLQFGGITGRGNSDYYNHVHLLDVNRMQWEDVQLSGSFNAQRHSMACTTFGAHTVIVNGGLHLNENFAGKQLQVIDQRDHVVRNYDIEGLEQSFYSHQLKCIDYNQILMLGGIGSNNIDNSVHVIDMRQLGVVHKCRVHCPNNVLMLFNFSCELYQSGNIDQLYVFGGGGNCFSFGSHFNPTYTLNVNKILGKYVN